MSKVEFQLTATVDEAALVEHVAATGGNDYPIVDDASEFQWIDLEAAIDKGLVEDVEITGFTVVG